MIDIAFGVHEKCAPADTMAAYPGALHTREFFTTSGEIRPGTDLIAMLHQTADPTWQVNGTPVVSLKFKPADVTAGLWDAPCRKLGAELARCPKCYVIFYHEPEDNYLGNVMAPTFNRVRANLKLGHDSLPVCYCAGSYSWRPGDLTDRRRTADVVSWQSIQADLYLCDVYSGNSFPSNAILPEHSGFARWKQEIVDPFPGRKWGIGERGWMAGPGRVATMQRELDWLLGLNDPNFQMYLLWNTPGAEGQDGWVFDAPAQMMANTMASQLVMPAGFSPIGDGFLVHRASGIVIDPSRRAAFEAFYATAMMNG